MNEEGGTELVISTGLVRHPDGTFGVWARVSFLGRQDVEPAQQVLTDASGGPASFRTEREAKIASFDWIEDMRRDAMNNPPPGSTDLSGTIERADES